jgi:pantetheine-phosphate adenylyltransferase
MGSNYVVIGGTFDNLHLGHKALIQKAFEIGDKVLVCITSDEMIKKKPFPKEIESYEKRNEKLAEFLKEKDWIGRAEIAKIEDPFTPGLRPGLTHIIVSEQTRPNAKLINDIRKKKGLKPLKIVEIGWVMAKDGNPISDARVRKGEIDRKGNLL